MSEHMAAAARFVILAAPRSGSNQLCTLLNSHPEILCHHEVYNPSAIFYALEYRGGSLDLGTIDDRDRRRLNSSRGSGPRTWARSSLDSK